MQVVLLVLADHVDADGVLELEDQAGADRVDDRRGAALLALHRVVEVAVLDVVDVGHGAAARHVGHPVGQQRAAYDEDAGGRRTADQLVRAEEHRVDPVHRQVDVRRRGGEVPQRQRAVLVQQRREAGHVAEDPGDVGRRREGADEQRPVGELGQPRRQEGLVDVAVGVLGADHDVGDRLAPRQLVGVVLERADEHHGPLVGGDVRRTARGRRRAPRGCAGRGCRSAWRSRRCCRSPRR